MKKLQAPTPDEAQLFELVQLARPLYRTLVRAVEQQLEGTGISVALRGMLEVLADVGPQTVPQIALRHGVGRQFVQRLMDDAAAAGLVRRDDNPAHRRSVLFSLTPKGRAAFDRIRARELVVTRRIANGVKRSDVAAAVRVVSHMIREFPASP